MDHVVTADGRLRVWETFRRVKPGELYAYLTDPAKLTLWWPNEAQVDATPGGSYRFAVAGGEISGTFAEAEPGRRLAFSYRAQGGAESQVVVDLEPRDADTLLTVTQGPFGSEAERRAQLDEWTRLFKRLKGAARA